ncbi:hypothetical protein LEP1GSC060_0554 [Leptospira weilii serovar Ranarum str. ICFT]|uniref:Ankyrin repeat protein n=1 Tax=Leptospira weilii serovar Ranarum str. ICFT TaxID=1218598 RepID=N1WEN8_9LEPT|nr:DUF4303 domain-containing protein [Leptospira weilii]EMY78716.1 hypothetical protein LEP1GSC060_0554 [Leptospira weilii serovar Ranarum str. ICFT]
MNKMKLIQKNRTRSLELILENERLTVEQYQGHNRILSQTYAYENADEAFKERNAFIKWKTWNLFFPEEEGPDYADRWRSYWLGEFPERKISRTDLSRQVLLEAVKNRDIEFFLANQLGPGFALQANSAKHGDPILIYAIKMKSISIVDYLLDTMWLDPSVKDQNGFTAWDHVFQAKDPFLGNLFLEHVMLLGSDEERNGFQKELGLPTEQETDLSEPKEKVDDNRTKQGFDVEALTNFSIQKIESFAKAHVDETFYGFAIDASYIKMNSLESFEKTLQEYQLKWPNAYDTSEKIQKLKNNVGDWKYILADFQEMNEENDDGFTEGPFDEDLYNEHYEADDLEQKNSGYARAMDAILNNLQEKRVFQSLKNTTDFICFRTEHNY